MLFKPCRCFHRTFRYHWIYKSSRNNEEARWTELLFVVAALGASHAEPLMVGMPPVSPESRAEAEAWISRGQALEDRGELDGALDCYRQAALCTPEFPRAHLNIGNALRGMHRTDEARAAFGEAIRLDPNHAHGHFNLALLCSVVADFPTARAELQEVMRLQPDLVARVLDAESFILFASGLRGDVDPETLAREHFRVGKAIAEASAPAYDHWPNPPDPLRKLRVGYVSADFGPHPVALFLRPVLERHDRAHFDIYCYSNAAPETPIGTGFQQLSLWRDVTELSDRECSELVRADEIDILVDLSGHSEGHRLGMFAQHPAPVQATWLGYLNTTGLAAMDYRVCDWQTDPQGETERLHTEQLVRLPQSQWCYEPWGAAAPPTMQHRDATAPVVFGSFNQYAKISEVCLDLWSRILGRVPNSRLTMLDVRDEHARTRILERLARRGIPPDRVELRGREPIADYHHAISSVDIALDAWPHNGATTTFDALWMGTPLVALRGDRGIARSSASILHTLGMLDLIADTAEHYVNLNVRLALDPGRRMTLRGELRPRLMRSALMNMNAFVADLEAAYRGMWRRWYASQTRRR
jgi:protein O-GlcNAc transferase